jgi:hypothetical protein
MAESYKLINEWEIHLSKNWLKNTVDKGIIIDNNENIFLFFDDILQKYSKEGTFIAEWNTFKNEKCRCINDIALDNNGDILIIDNTGSKENIFKILKINSNGNLINKWNFDIGYGPVIDDHELSIGVNKRNEIYAIASTYISKFDSNGNLLAKYKSNDFTSGRLYHSHFIDRFIFDDQFNLYTTAYGRIIKYNPDWESKKQKLRENCLITNIEHKCYPHKIIIDNKNYIYTCGFLDQKTSIVKLTPDLKVISEFGGDMLKKNLSHPIGIAVDSNYDMYIIDRYYNKIQKFAMEKSFFGKLFG